MTLNFGPAKSIQDTGGAVHDAVVRQHYVHLRIVIVGLRLGPDVRRRAGDHHHLDVVGLLERVEHMPGLGFFQGPAVHADVQRLGPRNGQAAGQAGSRITHIAKATGLTQATTHRLPQSLVAKRIVEQDASFRLYRLSISFFSGREGWKRHGSAHAEPPFHAPAVWLDRDEGPFQIRSFTGDIGGRVALGVS